MGERVKIANTNDVAPGKVRSIAVAGKRLALCNVDGQFYLIDDICTHDGGPLDQGELFGYEIECPRHGARFDVRTGRVRRLPAILPIRTYPVTVEEDEVLVDTDALS